MGNKVTVSVIIPFFSNINWLVEAIESVFAQTYTDFEVIVVNDGSPEDISDFVANYGDRITYTFKNNGGPASARNLGVDIANGEYIAFLDSDDIWSTNKLERQVNFMKRTNAVWSHTNYSSFKDGNPEGSKKNINLSYFHGMVFPICLASAPIATPCVMIKAQYLTDNPDLRFNEEMRFGQDWYLWIKLSMKQPIFLLPESLTKVRLRGKNASLRARVQLSTKAYLWTYMKTHTELFFGENKINWLLGLAYKLSWIGSSIVDFIEERITHSPKFLEFVSRVNYLIPYSILKTIAFFHYIRIVKLNQE